MNEKAKEARRKYIREYMRKYRQRPDWPEKRKKYNERYWEKKAQEMKEEACKQ